MENRLFFLINQAQRKLYTAVDREACERLDAPVAQVAALLSIPREGARPSDIGHSMRLHSAATTGLVARMHKRGLVTKEPSEHDGRASVVRLTERGVDLRRRIGPLIAEMNEQIRGDFTDEELEVVVRFLNHVLEQFDEGFQGEALEEVP